MESAFMLALQSMRIDGLTQLLVLISSLGNSALIWFILAVVLLPFAEKRGVGLLLIITLIVTSVVAYLILANIIGRPHPNEVVQGLVAVAGVTRTGYSMPSLHAATSFAAAVLLMRTCGKNFGMPALVLAVLICFARMYLGVQYPTDILVGAILGSVIAFVASMFYGRIFDSSAPKPEKANRRRSL